VEPDFAPSFGTPGSGLTFAIIPPHHPGMDRRRFLLTSLAGALGVPHAAHSQSPPPRMPRIGYLSLRSGPSHLDEAFQQGLRELGYIEGQSISVEYRWADWKPDRGSALALELARLKMDLIVATPGAAAVRAVQTVTKTIPIVFTAGDAIGSGLVTSLERPGGNVTGVNLLNFELAAKRLELLRDVVPAISRVAVLVNPTTTTPLVLKDLERAARALGVKIQLLEVRDPIALEDAFSLATRERAGALLVLPDPRFFAERERLVSLAAKTRLPASYEWREFAEAGGLMSYGANVAGQYRRLASYVDKILKGTKPADLPIEQPTKFELVINLKTAKALGLTIPQSFLLRADQVIE
jgi:putative tryptophan/tyrosine transport system substrate-binding protein